MQKLTLLKVSVAIVLLFVVSCGRENSASVSKFESASFLTAAANSVDPVADRNFLYGSIGTDHRASMPFELWRVFPKLCEDTLPQKGKEGYENFGFLFEPDQVVPMGLSVSAPRATPFRRVGPTCAVCHTSTYRVDELSDPQLVYGMPAQNLDIMRYLYFLVECASDEERVNFRAISDALEELGTPLTGSQRLALRLLLPVLRSQSAKGLSQYQSILDHAPPSGVGRDDSVNPYKFLYFEYEEIPREEIVGNSKFMSVFNGRLLDDMWTHWDGSVKETETRNAIVALGSASKQTFRLAKNHLRAKASARLAITNYLRDVSSPAYPLDVDESIMNYVEEDGTSVTGRDLYDEHCSQCHGTLAQRYGEPLREDSLVGGLTHIDELGTDASRLLALSEDFVTGLPRYIAQISQPEVNLRRTNSFRNSYLDGVFLRAPYLHNGSVPTIADLLEPASRRPVTFYKGVDVLDHERLGFLSREQQLRDAGIELGWFEVFDSREPGNSNVGHEYGTNLSSREKRAIVEYLKLF